MHETHASSITPVRAGITWRLQDDDDDLDELDDEFDDDEDGDEDEDDEEDDEEGWQVARRGVCQAEE